MIAQPSPDRPTPEKARRDFRDEAARAWRDYVKTGRHATQDELDAWIDSISR
jgi:predicted transcriptional regulator